MQFNSYSFILLFLPLFVLLWFLLNRIHPRLGKILLILSGGLFYSFAGPESSAVLAFSVAANLLFSLLVQRAGGKARKRVLAAGIALNVLLLFVFKYTNFAIGTINRVLGTDIAFLEILLPLGISFFTFQQIMYLVSVYRGEVEKVSAEDYLCYILFFPKLIMGPLMEPKDFLAQLRDPSIRRVNAENLAGGIKLFSLGLFKKMLLADTFAKGVAWGFANKAAASAADWWLVMLFYTFEIYFDFSGYSDMATGVAQMINITLPMNFNSPYKALSIRDFWKRWHMSLTGFLTRYVYFPLGGSRKGKTRTYINILLVFLVSGLWHGTNWTFVVWGLLHGLLQVAERILPLPDKKPLRPFRWVLTFLLVNLLWLLFREETVPQWFALLGRMFSFGNMAVSEGLMQAFVLPESAFLLNVARTAELSAFFPALSMGIITGAALLLCLIPDNNYNRRKSLNAFNLLLSAAAFVWAFLCLGGESVFVYFNF